MSTLAEKIRSIFTNSRYAKQDCDTFGHTQCREGAIVSIQNSLVNGDDWRVNQALRVAQQTGHDVMGRDWILDDGAGVGVATIVARMKGINWQAIEPDETALELSKELAEAVGISQETISEMFVSGNGENLDFGDDRFAICVAHQVIEHVGNKYDYISEIYRVLKPHGALIMYAPEYNLPYEPHFGIPWIPYMNKKFARIWVEQFRKSADGLSNFNYISKEEIAAIAHSVGFNGVKIGWALDSTSPERFQSERMRIFGGSSDFHLSEERIIEIASRIQSNNEQYATDSFWLIAQKQ